MPTPHALIALLCAFFVALGLSIATLGPALPEFAQVAGLPVSAMGVLYSALFAGFLASQVSAALLLDRVGTRPTILGAIAVFAAGTAALAVAPGGTSLLAGSAVLGAGYGFGTIGINLVASRLLPHRPAFVVNLINALYGVGTVIGPLITSAALRTGGQARWVPLVGGVCALGLLPWAWRVLPGDPAPPLRTDGPTTGHRAVPTALVLIGVLVFLYGGVESGFSGWAPTYLEQILGVSPADAALAMSAYWSSYLAGRIVSTLLALRVGPATVLWGALAVLAAGGACLLAGVGERLPTTVALILLGGATGPIYPSMFGVVTSRFADRAAFAVSTVAAIGCVGAILLPWGMGLTLPLAGGRVLASFPLLLCLGMALALYGARPRGPR